MKLASTVATLGLASAQESSGTSRFLEFLAENWWRLTLIISVPLLLIALGIAIYREGRDRRGIGRRRRMWAGGLTATMGTMILTFILLLLVFVWALSSTSFSLPSH